MTPLAEPEQPPLHTTLSRCALFRKLIPPARRRELEETAAAMQQDLARLTAAEGRQRAARRREQA